MTNKDRLISYLAFTPADDAVEGELIDIDINGSAIYDGTYKVELKTAAIRLMELLLTTPDNTNEMPLYRISYDRGAVQARIKLLKVELGLLNDGPIITGLHIW